MDLQDLGAIGDPVGVPIDAFTRGRACRAND
jgi:hypothetical protein